MSDVLRVKVNDRVINAQTSADVNSITYLFIYLHTYLRHTYSAAVTTLTDTACTYSGYSGPRGGVAA